MGFVWVHADSFLHCVASPFHSFVTTYLSRLGVDLCVGLLYLLQGFILSVLGLVSLVLQCFLPQHSRSQGFMHENMFWFQLKLMSEPLPIRKLRG